MKPEIPSFALVSLCGILLAASVPLWELAAVWTSLLLGAACLYRAVGRFRVWGTLGARWRLLLLAGAATAIYLKSHTFFDVESGFGVLLVLVSLKLLESAQPRDFLVLVILGYFLALCSLFFSQDLTRWLYVAAVVALLTAAAIHLQMGGRLGVARPALRLSVVMLLQAFPLAVLLFVFVPRPYLDFRIFPGSTARGVPAMSDHMQPGSVAGLASQTGRAFRAFLGDRFPPPPYYWRSVVLWDGNGLNWERGNRLQIEPRAFSAHGRAVKQQITLEPHGDRWLFALDRPVSTVKDAFYEPGGTLRSIRAINGVLRYEVISQPDNEETHLLPDQLMAARRKPASVSPQVQALADSFRNGASDDAEVVQRALAFFRQGNFTYSYAPGTYATSDLDDFLFKRRTGFCEHYAAAFATLMRLTDVPSRIVLGYLGGEEGLYGHYIIVNQSDAHAWCEVWLKGHGWVREDPTSAAAPDRLNSGLYNYLAGQRAVAPLTDPGNYGGWYSSTILREMRLFWDGLTYQWDLHVLTFNREVQSDFLALLFGSALRYGQLLSGVLLLSILFVAGLAYWLQRPCRLGRDRARLLYARLTRRLAKAGLPTTPQEGPLALASRAAQRFPAQAGQLQEIGALYARIRYGPSPPPVQTLAAALRELGPLKKE